MNHGSYSTPGIKLKRKEYAVCSTATLGSLVYWMTNTSPM